MSDRLWDISGARNYLVDAPSDISDAPADLTDRLSDNVVQLPDMVGALQHRSDQRRNSVDQQ